ncbi:MAG: hypothetical protein P4L79_17220 [Legionella sp.]|uniref:hypothetical protein n=1 Tax=Legionella sp. TaxID=459 RepID=UPI00284F0B1C|nr:hypothetical protein [Legionella sp.]
MLQEGTKGNFKKEAEALYKAGYATNPNYPHDLVIVGKGPTMRASIEYARKRKNG